MAAIQNIAIQHHAGRTHHRSVNIRQTQTTLIPHRQFLAAIHNLRIDQHQRHPGIKQCFAGRGIFLHGILRDLNNHQPQRFTDLRCRKADTVKHPHGTDHPFRQCPDLRRDRRDHCRFRPQNTVSQRPHNITLFTAEHHINTGKFLL